jgi:hypothetical protein
LTIGVDTALNIALEDGTRLRLPGPIAGMPGGAEAVLIPEVPTEPEAVAQELAEGTGAANRTRWLVVGEAAKPRARKAGAPLATVVSQQEGLGKKSVYSLRLSGRLRRAPQLVVYFLFTGR